MSPLKRRSFISASVTGATTILMARARCAGWDQIGNRTTLGTGIFTSAIFSANGNRLLTGAFDKNAQLWDIETGRLLHVYVGHTETVRTATFSADERQVITASGREADMGSISTDNSIRIWNTETGMELNRLLGHSSYVYSAIFSPDGKHVLSSARDATARLWSLDSSREIHRFSGLRLFRASVFNPKGSTILAIENRNLPFRARVWSALSGDELARLEGHEGSIETAQFSADGSAIVTASRDSTARIWDPQTGRQVQRFDGHDGPVLSADFSASGKSILTASADGKARLWNVADGSEIRRFSHRGEVRQAMLKEGSARLLTKWGGAESTFVSLWDSDRGKEITRWQLPNIYGRQIAILNPGGTRILATLTKTTLLDAVSGDKVREFD